MASLNIQPIQQAQVWLCPTCGNPVAPIWPTYMDFEGQRYHVNDHCELPISHREKGNAQDNDPWGTTGLD